MLTKIDEKERERENEYFETNNSAQIENPFDESTSKSFDYKKKMLNQNSITGTQSTSTKSTNLSKIKII